LTSSRRSDEWPAAFIYGDGMQPDIDVIAEAGVMKLEAYKADISRERG